MIPDTLNLTLRQLRLGGLRNTLDVRLQEARASQLDYIQFLELLLQDELDIRQQRKIQRWTKKAGFREQKTLEAFDFAFNASVNRQDLYELATCKFIGEARDLLFAGPPGVGKSHLAQAIGLSAIRSDHTVLYRSIFDVARDFMRDEAMLGETGTLPSYLRVDLLIIDDMGMKELPRKSGEYLFEVIMRRHGLKSTIMTTNRPLEDWGKLLGDNATASAVLDRFMSASDTICIDGRSYRLKDKALRKQDIGIP